MERRDKKSSGWNEASFVQVLEQLRFLQHTINGEVW